jgi:peptidoglycan/xylan/chitin deacetylase (PgdA/CDA1 family)
MNKTEIALRILKSAGAFAVARARTRRKLRILCYHGLWLGGPPHYGDCLYMSQAKFESRMEWLARSGYPVLPLDEALRRLDDDSLPDNAVSITIDDGWYSTYCGMLPVLKRLGLPATLYVTTYYATRGLPVLNVLIGHLIDRAPETALRYELLPTGTEPSPEPPASPEGRSFLAERLSSAVDALPFEQRWPAVETLASSLGMADRLKQLVESRAFHLMTEEQIRQAAAAGMDVQLHTHTHRMHEFDAALIGAEIDRNRRELARITGRPSADLRHFCYPSGVHTRDIFEALRARTVVSATTTEFGLVDRLSERMALSRILDCESFSQVQLEARLCGLWSLVAAARH